VPLLEFILALFINARQKELAVRHTLYGLRQEKIQKDTHEELPLHQEWLLLTSAFLLFPFAFFLPSTLH
jgi:hypothetical protein